MGMSKLTVRFEDPFWVGIVEVEDERATRSPVTSLEQSPQPRRSCVSCATGGENSVSRTASRLKLSRRSESTRKDFAE